MATNPNDMNPDAFIEYLAKHGVTDVKQRGDEVSFACPFNGCDDDHRNNEEYHCSFNCKKCAYFCLKCGEKGNFITLLKHFGDYEQYDAAQKTKQASARNSDNRRRPKLSTLIQKALSNQTFNEKARHYFNNRGINDESMRKYSLGYWDYDGMHGYMIPVTNKDGDFAYIKLRRTLEDEQGNVVAKSLSKSGSTVPKYLVYPAGSQVVLVGEDELQRSTSMDVLICEGELDRIIAIQEGVRMPVVASGGGVQTFKDDWLDQLKNMRNIYLCMDSDEAGNTGCEKLAKRLVEHIPSASIYKITLPFEDNSHGDLTDYFVKKCGTADELFDKYADYYCGAKPIDVSKFDELSITDIANILDLTIKYDYSNKVITFLAMLLAYTDSDQLNIMFNASSSTGKSFICHEVSQYFPQQDVNVYGKTTPTAFYYSRKLRRKNPETNEPYIDLERRIMIFVEQPDTKLQENLRAILSHEKKTVPFAITNREKGGRNASDEGYILGYPSTFFCSANTNIDEQEQTRCLILSPDSTREKVMAGIDAYIDKSCHRNAFEAKVASDEDRKLLMERIRYIKSLHVDSIDINDSDYLKKRFLEKLVGNVPPKAMREIGKVTSLAKAVALINAPHRMVNGKITVSRDDIDQAVDLWGSICESMVYGVPPQVFDFYKKVVIPAWLRKNKGICPAKGVSNIELRAEHFRQMGCFPDTESIRRKWVPMLRDAGFIRCEKLRKEQGGDDGRELLVTPLDLLGKDLDEYQ